MCVVQRNYVNSAVLFSVMCHIFELCPRELLFLTALKVKMEQTPIYLRFGHILSSDSDGLHTPFGIFRFQSHPMDDEIPDDIRLALTS